MQHVPTFSRPSFFSVRALLRGVQQERERRGRRGAAEPGGDAAGVRGQVRRQRRLRRVVPRGRQHHR